MDQEFLNRLRLVKAKFGFSYEEMGNMLNVSKDTAGNYITGRTEMSIAQVAQLASILGFDANWLFSGEGENPVTGITTENTASLRETQTTYRRAQAGRSMATHNRVQLRNLVSAIVDDLPDDVAYDIFEVEGSSMETTLSAGDKLICRMESIENMLDNRVYVLVTNDPIITGYNPSGVWIKRCNHRAANGYISCRSDNKETTEPYPTFRLKTESIKEVWYPVLKVTAHMTDPNRDIYNRIDELESRIEMLEFDKETEE